jgi:hypothetical protein
MSQTGEKELALEIQKLFECLKKYFDLKNQKNYPHELGCEVGCSHIEMMEQRLIRDIQDELKNPRFQINPKRSRKIDQTKYDDLMKNLVNDRIVQMFEQFLLLQLFSKNLFFETINSFVINEVNHLLGQYTEELMRLSKEADEHDLSLEDQNQKRERLYNCFISSVKTIAMDLVPTYEVFYKSEINWNVDSSRGTALHILTNTVHELTDRVLPYYLGTSVLEEKPVHVFMDGKTGEVFTVPIAE